MVHFQAALKQYPSEPDDMFYQEQKLAELSQKPFIFMLHVLPFLLRKFFKTVGELLHLLTLQPKFIFQGALEKSCMVLEQRSNQTLRWC